MEHIKRNIRYANSSPKGRLLNHGNGITGIISKVKILVFKKMDFWPKIYEKFLEGHWPFWSIYIVYLSDYMQLVVQRVLILTVVVG